MCGKKNHHKTKPKTLLCKTPPSLYHPHTPISHFSSNTTLLFRLYLDLERETSLSLQPHSLPIETNEDAAVEELEQLRV